MKKHTTTKKTTITQTEGYITGDDIRKAFDLPDHAKVYFRVPGGADWSCVALDISREDPIYVVWEETTEEES